MSRRLRGRDHKRARWLVILATTLVADCLPVHAQHAHFGTEHYARDPWMVRLDTPTDPARTVIDASGTGIRVTTRAGAIVWRPADRIAGAFTVKASVRLAAGTPGGAGLFFTFVMQAKDFVPAPHPTT